MLLLRFPCEPARKVEHTLSETTVLLFEMVSATKFQSPSNCPLGIHATQIEPSRSNGKSPASERDTPRRHVFAFRNIEFISLFFREMMLDLFSGFFFQRRCVSLVCVVEAQDQLDHRVRIHVGSLTSALSNHCGSALFRGSLPERPCEVEGLSLQVFSLRSRSPSHASLPPSLSRIHRTSEDLLVSGRGGLSHSSSCL